MTGGGFSDHFSAAAAGYARHRPTYPAALFDFLAGLVPVRERAWDCATGSGQAARGLAAHFDEVVATDASEQQVRNAAACRGVRYRVCPADRSGLDAAGVDLVAVAQAAHWFDLDGFYREVRRVARPHAVLALWCYGLAGITPPVDAVIREFYSGMLGPFWPQERRHVEQQYQTLPFPFVEVRVPTTLSMNCRWRLEDLVGYLSTWSAVGRYRASRGGEPLDRIRGDLTRAWGDPSGAHSVCWPLALRAGRVHPGT